MASSCTIFNQNSTVLEEKREALVHSTRITICYLRNYERNNKISLRTCCNGERHPRQVSDFITNPPTENQFTQLKDKLISRFSDSEERKIEILLNELELGDKKPSTLLREMKNLASDQITGDFLRGMFLQRLPSNVRSILATSTEELDKLASMADKILDISTPNNCSITSVNQSNRVKFTQLRKKRRKLTAKNEDI
ncbi:uncharacterized protein LOC123302832 [Chrysoperla carnea]|uniref:uncharacterized protein LOC123302832 n=1 Tax=Chrysoperla carnea TaxID=189513 RepID=UPI001D097EB1|nr:uncharacterized protein LOC123302832 [Chrysoperla carnea]